MTSLTQREIELLRPDLEQIIDKSDNYTDIVLTLEKCLTNGYDRKRTTEKLGHWIDSKKASRLYDRLQNILDERKNVTNLKRVIDDNDDKVTKKMRTSIEPPNEMHIAQRASTVPASAPAATLPIPSEKSLTSQQITMMMANAQREIEERKKVLSALKSKDQEDVERAKKIAMLQAQIKAKLSGTLSAFIPPPAQEKPKPLILDEQGRTVDNSGRAISIPTLAPTLKANIRAKKKESFTKGSYTNDRQPDDQSSKFIDERINTKPAIRTKRNLRFHEPGKFQQMAEKLRMKAQLEKLQNEISQIARKTGISSATKLALIAPKQDSHAEDVPQMEWWDSVILANDLKTMDGDHIAIRDSSITNLIEHPTQMKPPSKRHACFFFVYTMSSPSNTDCFHLFIFSDEPIKPVYLPVFLTKAEQKKLRRQNRREAWKEEQEKIRLGLIPPPEPKLRIANLMRALGNEAVQDPTKIESHVREQMAKRQKAHEDANNARKLTAEQKREKKIRKVKEDVSCGVSVAVYRIRELNSFHSKKFKVEQNAKQLLMTGTVVLFRDCCVVVVEGGPKQQKKYKRLMLHRIKWDEDTVKNADGNEVPNSCTLVWEGTTQRRHFGEMKFKLFPMEKMAREFFQKHQVNYHFSHLTCPNQLGDIELFVLLNLLFLRHRWKAIGIWLTRALYWKHVNKKIYRNNKL